MTESGRSKGFEAQKFRKGQSGNRRGRPKGTPNARTIVHQIASELHAVTMKEGVARLTTAELILRALSAKAMAGNIAASKELERLRQRYKPPDELNVLIFYADNGRD